MNEKIKAHHLQRKAMLLVVARERIANATLSQLSYGPRV